MSASVADSFPQQPHPIDLTEDDDDDDMEQVDTSAVDERHSKRQRTGTEGSIFIPQTPFMHPAQVPRGFRPNPSSVPAMPPYRPPQGFSAPHPPFTPPTFQHPHNPSLHHPHRHGQTASNLHHPRPQHPPPKKRGHVRQVIDLTSSPSPPPDSSPPRSHPAQHAYAGQLPPDTPARATVCIGQIHITSLILYPVPYLIQRPPGTSLAEPGFAPDFSEYAPVKLKYDPAAKQRSPTGNETIHISTPQFRLGEGEEERTLGGDNFGVVEQKVANVLGPMLCKGLIRLDAKVRRGGPRLSILPLEMLVCTPKGNIPIVASYLQKSGLMLDHPTTPFDASQLASQNVLYSNPHNPPPGGFQQNGVTNNSAVAGRSGWAASRWSQPVVAGKTVEVQRSQVDEMFKNLRSGDELEETDAPPEINTHLYPHQKKALTFLLDREGELSGTKRDPTSQEPQQAAERWGEGSSSLWQARRDPVSGRVTSWAHPITQKQVQTEPKECKAALLADDMGLGKTITCVSLLASTLPSAQAFAAAPLPPRPDPPSRLSSSEPGLTPGHFAGAVWGMPEPSAKSKSKQKAEEKREAIEYARACRIKNKSRGTLIICPLSTVSNWEDQLKEHWAGDVTVVGGSAGGNAAMSQTTRSKRSGAKPIRVYVYHGNARCAEPSFLADFDVVITTFSTLATEYSRQARSIEDDEDDDEVEEAQPEDYNVLAGQNAWTYPNAAVKSKGKKRKKALGAGGVEQSSPLQMVSWFRVVLDEAHSIKETSTVASRASCDLIADRRLCLTGTPVQNKLDDVYALIKFLRLEPFDDKGIWTEYIGGPVKFGQPLGVARLQAIMKCLTLRRTKQTRTAEGKKILDLPPRTDELRLLRFDDKEQQIYDGFFNDSRAEFTELSKRNEVMKNYVGILQKILRLRQICNHFELVKGKGVYDEDAADSMVNYDELCAEIAREGISIQRGMTIFGLLRDAGTAQCVECGFELATSSEGNMDGVDVEEAPSKKSRKKTGPAGIASRGPTRASSPSSPRAVLTRCQHLFCIECYSSSVCPGWPKVPEDSLRACAVCQIGLYPVDAVEISSEAPLPTEEHKIGAKRDKQSTAAAASYYSTKVKALMGDLAEYSKANPHSKNYNPNDVEVQLIDGEGNNVDDGPIKTVVFSQWTSMLDKVEDALEVAGIKYDRLDGTMKRDDRSRAMDALKHDPACEVLLVSLKAGGVGLNLTAAQRVYIMDPYWNPAVENQAVDRIHRLGQTRPVKTVKLIIDNTIETRLLEVQKRKTALANMTLTENVSKAELMQRRMEELNQLFAT